MSFPVYNRLEISAPYGVLACLAKLKSDIPPHECLDFGMVIPMELRDWGTPSNAIAPVIEGEATDRLATIAFQTAATPPLPVVTALSKKFHGLRFWLRYDEPKLRVAGDLCCRDERVLRKFHVEGEFYADTQKLVPTGDAADVAPIHPLGD